MHLCSYIFQLLNKYFYVYDVLPNMSRNLLIKNDIYWLRIYKCQVKLLFVWIIYFLFSQDTQREENFNSKLSLATLENTPKWLSCTKFGSFLLSTIALQNVGDLSLHNNHCFVVLGKTFLFVISLNLCSVNYLHKPVR